MRFSSKMQACTLFFALFAPAAISQLTNLTNSDIHMCVRCVCHAVTACYSLENCAQSSIDFEYWQNAGAPRLVSSDGRNMDSYGSCIADSNCIIHTIYQYTVTNNNGNTQCSSHETDCRDVVRLHIHKRRCGNLQPQQRTRYGNCATRAGLPTEKRDAIFL